MPNAAEYRAAAHRLRALGEGYARLGVLVTRSRAESHLDVGPVAAAVLEALAGVSSRLAFASAEMVRLAGVCDARAVVCDEYARRVREHLTATPFAWPRAPLPVPPYPWVDAA